MVGTTRSGSRRSWDGARRTSTRPATINPSPPEPDNSLSGQAGEPHTEEWISEYGATAPASARTSRTTIGTSSSSAAKAVGSGNHRSRRVRAGAGGVTARYVGRAVPRRLRTRTVRPTQRPGSQRPWHHPGVPSPNRAHPADEVRGPSPG
jgi:hypothetical protein